MSTNSIITVHKEKSERFCIAPTELLHSSLSWEAIGVLSYLLTKPSNWVIRVKDIVNHSSNGRMTVDRCIKELQNTGYLIRIRNGIKIRIIIANQPVFLSDPNFITEENIIKLPISSFTMINALIPENSSLTWRAKGIFCYMLSLKNNSKFSPKFLCKKNCSLSSIYSKLKELNKYGYIKTINKRNKGEFNGINYIISEQPQRYKEKPHQGLREDSNIKDLRNRSINSSKEKNTLNLESLFQTGFRRGLSYIEKQELKKFIEKFSAGLVIEALRRAVARGKLFISYIAGILKNWATAGVQTVADIFPYERKFKNKQKYCV